MTQPQTYLALDLGTTSLAGVLLGLDGERLGECQLPNPQKRFGTDVLTRLEAARNGHADELQSLLVSGIEGLVNRLCVQTGTDRSAIRATAAAANPAITTLLCNLPVEPILFPPYRPAATSGVDFDLQTVGLGDLPPLFIFPLVNGFVGGDLIAFLFGQTPPKSPTLYIDVGTNAEMALYDGKRWQVTSVAAGPAFEGEGITSGMAHGDGAITAVSVVGDRLVLDVTGGGVPHGVCGSGLVEIHAAALGSGLINSHGTILDPGLVSAGVSRYLQPENGGVCLQLYRDATRRIVVTQQDVRSFQLAKAAVKAGIGCMLDRTGIDTAEIRQVVLTGAFGFSLTSEALKMVDMIPANMVDRVRFEAGGALSGICRMLSEEGGRKQVDVLSSGLKPYPLSGTPAFEKAFIKAIDFKPC